MLGERLSLTGCSRTDAGVHAKSFHCHLDCDENLPENAFVRGLSALLPPDISVLEAKEVSPDFHARYNAKGKTYIYRILNSNIKDLGVKDNIIYKAYVKLKEKFIAK